MLHLLGILSCVKCLAALFEPCKICVQVGGYFHAIKKGYAIIHREMSVCLDLCKTDVLKKFHTKSMST